MKIKVKKNNQIIAIVCLVCLIILIGIVVFLNMNDKTSVFKKITNTSFDTVDKILNKYKKIASPLDSTNLLKLDITSDNEIYNIELQNDTKNKIINLNGTITKDNNKLLEGSIIHQDSKTYINSAILNKIYELNLNLGTCDGTSCDEESGNINDIIDSLFTTNIYTYENLNTVSKKLRKDILSSLDKKYITKKNITTLINNKDTKTTRYAYPLNALSLNKLVNKIDKDKNLKDVLFQAFGDYFTSLEITKDNFKEKILTSKENIGTLNVYTVKNKIVKITLNIANGPTYELTHNEDNIILDLDNTYNNIKIIYNTNTQKINIYYYYDNTSSLELNITNTLSNHYSIEYISIINDEKSRGNIDLNITSSTDTYIEGNIKINNNITINYSSKTIDDLSKTDVSNSTDLENISELELENIKNIIAKLEDGSIFKFIKDNTFDEEESFNE